MTPVEQRRLWRPDDHPEGPQRGDCLRACVASILELPYEAVPNLDGTAHQLAIWISRVMPGVQVAYRYLSDTWAQRETLDSWKKWPADHHEPGYWIATVYSYRIPDVEEFGCGCADSVPGGDPACRWCHGNPGGRYLGIAWGLHAVVMRHGECVWDPHPERDKGFGPFRAATTFRVEDPALLAARLGLVRPGEEAA